MGEMGHCGVSHMLRSARVLWGVGGEGGGSVHGAT